MEERTQFNTCLADIPEDIMHTARSVAIDMKVRPWRGPHVPEAHIALAIWNERERARERV